MLFRSVQDVIEGRTRQQTLPLSEDTHAAVQSINQVMVQVSGARSQLVALLMGLSGRDSCAHLSRVLTELLVELDALDVSGNAAIRNYRKQVVEEINGLLKHLDLEGEGDDTRRYRGRPPVDTPKYVDSISLNTRGIGFVMWVGHVPFTV